MIAERTPKRQLRPEAKSREEQARDVRGHCVEKTVSLEVEWDPRDPVGEMDFIGRLRRETCFPTVAIAQARLDRDDVAEVLEHHATRDFVRGVRHKPRGSASLRDRRLTSMSDPRWRSGFARLRPLGLQFDLQTPRWHSDGAVTLARDLPDTQIVLLHTGLPADRSVEGISGWRDTMHELAQYPNVAVKISGIGVPGVRTVRDNWEIVLHTIESFGVDLCMFASNFPVDSVCGDLDTILSGYKTITSGFSADDRLKLFHHNAIRICRIDGWHRRICRRGPDGSPMVNWLVAHSFVVRVFDISAERRGDGELDTAAALRLYEETADKFGEGNQMGIPWASGIEAQPDIQG